MKLTKNISAATGAIALSMSMASSAGLYVSPSHTEQPYYPADHIEQVVVDNCNLIEIAEINKDVEMGVPAEPLESSALMVENCHLIADDEVKHADESETSTEFTELVQKDEEVAPEIVALHEVDPGLVDGLAYEVVSVHEVAPEVAVAREVEVEQVVVEEAHPISFGRSVPLGIALAEVVPKDVAIYMDDDLEEVPVSWDESSDWIGVIQSISRNNPIKITYNEKENRMGISEVVQISEMMANTYPNQYYLSPDRSVRKNLELWAGLNGWELAWDVNFDLPVTHPAVFNGEFKEVISEIIKALSSNTKPLSAVLYTKNSVIQIVNGGFRKEEL
jgi:hypothetical protein